MSPDSPADRIRLLLLRTGAVPGRSASGAAPDGDG
jgi:hypothetical protein